MKVKEAAAITGSMTRTSKMPGLSYSLPAWECKTGSKLRKIKMIESERASERAGGPARKQEYVVVKKKKLLTYLIMGLYST